MEFSVELTDVEVKALSSVMADPAEWTRNAIKERARLAMIEIVNQETTRMISDPDITEIPASEDEIVMNYVIPEILAPQPLSE
jgi:CO dehydrogenase/acetyl-CoA synthase delta subunit